jgi:hypothetical protein
MMKLDWLGMRAYRTRLVVSVVTACVWGVVFNTGAIIPLLVFGMFDAALYCFDAEEKGKLNQLYLTLPISRGTLISARYALSLALQGFGIVAGIVLTLVLSPVMYGRTLLMEHTFKPGFGSLALLSCMGLFYCAVLSLAIHPTLHKFGYAKAKVLGYALPMWGSFILIGVFFGVLLPNFEGVRVFFNSAMQWALGNVLLTSFILLGLTALVVAASYKLSQRFYAKRDF